MKTILVLMTIVLVGCVAPVTQRIAINNVEQNIEAKKQSEVALQTIVDDNTRIYRVAYQISTKASSLCPDTRYALGVMVANNTTFGLPFKEASASVYGMTDIIKIFYVEQGSPADSAGIKVGDIPISINGWTVPTGDKATVELFKQLPEFLKDGQPIEVTFLRGADKQTVKINPIKTCAYSVMTNQDDTVNAFADGKNVVINKGMMRFTKDDTELSLVVAHEMAHNAMKHMDAKKMNASLGSILDIAAAALRVNTQGAFGKAAAGAFSQDFEAEADYVGLYMMAVAGLDIEDAPKFWRRMAADHPGSIKTNHAATHPATPYRFLALEEAEKEIKSKIANGLPLVPEKKKKN